MPHCDEGLRIIGRALVAYQKSSQGQNPVRLEVLVEADLVSPWALVCPAGPFGVGECSYVYRGGDLSILTPDKMVVAYDKGPWHKQRRNILFADGQVKRLVEDKFEKTIVHDNQFREQLQLPPKPVGK